MSNIQIPNLPVAIALNGTELLEAVQTGVSVRITTAQLGVLLHAMATTTILGQYNASLPSYSDGATTTIQTDGNGRLIFVGGGAAGAPAGGVLSAQGFSYSSAVSVTRPNDTAPYSANDVIGAATGATAALAFTDIGPAAGGEVMITTVSLEVDVSAVPAGMTSFNLFLYSVTPPSALGDNTAFDLAAGDRASFIDMISLGAPVDYGSTLYVATGAYNEQITVPAGGVVYGYLVSVGAFTPDANTVFKVRLKSAGL